MVGGANHGCVNRLPGVGVGAIAQDPDGKDPLSIAREMQSLGICMYSVLVQSWCQISDKTKWFFSGVSDVTGGRCLNLVDASLLKDTILSAGRENVDLESRMLQVQAKVEAMKMRSKKRVSAAAIEAETRKILASGPQLRALPVDKLVVCPPGRWHALLWCLHFQLVHSVASSFSNPLLLVGSTSGRTRVRACACVSSCV
jgi:hypothetical protein